MPDRDEVFEEALTGVDERRVGKRVEGPAKPDFMSCQGEELAGADEAFAEAAFEHFWDGGLDGRSFESSRKRTYQISRYLLSWVRRLSHSKRI